MAATVTLTFERAHTLAKVAAAKADAPTTTLGEHDVFAAFASEMAGLSGVLFENPDIRTMTIRYADRAPLVKRLIETTID